MAAMTVITATLPKVRCMASSTILRRDSFRPRLYVTAGTRPSQGSSAQEASRACDRAADGVKQGAKDVKDKVSSTAEEVNQKTKGVASNLSEKAQDLSEKAKETVQEAWGSAKEAGQKIKERVVGKAEDAKESIKENAEVVQRSMNTKNPSAQ